MKIELNDFSFEINSPTALALSRRIDDRGYRLYSIIKSLTKAHGYCYATNAYLAACLNTSESTIKRCIRSLKNEGVIEIQTDKTGIHWQRRIYLGVSLNKCLRRVTDDLPPDHGCTPPRSPVTHNNIVLNKDIVNKESPIVPKGDIPLPRKSKREEKKERVSGVWTTDTQNNDLLKRCKEDERKLTACYDKLSSWKIGKGIEGGSNDYKSIVDWVLIAIEKDSANGKSSSESRIQEDLKLIEKIKQKYPNHNVIYVGHNYIEFVFGPLNYIKIKVGDNGFRIQVENNLRKLNLSMEGL